jgi:hypothetical protein
VKYFTLSSSISKVSGIEVTAASWERSRGNSLPGERKVDCDSHLGTRAVSGRRQGAASPRRRGPAIGTAQGATACKAGRELIHHCASIYLSSDPLNAFLE